MNIFNSFRNRENCLVMPFECANLVQCVSLQCVLKLLEHIKEVWFDELKFFHQILLPGNFYYTFVVLLRCPSIVDLETVACFSETVYP